jgi:C1A family cysteine protease
MELLERKIYNTHTDLSRLFTYYVSRVLEGTVDYDSGATIRNSVKSLVKYGTPRESIWPYNIGNYKVNPSTDCYTEASTLQAVTYVALYSLDDIKTALYGGLPVDFGFNVYDSIYDTDLGVIPYPTPTEDLLGGHAVLAVG